MGPFFLLREVDERARIRDWTRFERKVRTDIEGGERGRCKIDKSCGFNRYVVLDTKTFMRVCEVVWSTQERRLDIY